MRAVPTLLALLLVCSVATAGGATTAEFDGAQVPPTAGPTASATDYAARHSPAVVATNATNGTNATAGHHVLSIPPSNVTNAKVDGVRLDAALAVSFDANASAERMETIALRQHIRAADSNDERQRRILDGMNELEKRVVTLRTMHRTTIAEYAAGRISTRELYVRLARIQAESDALERRLSVLSQFARETEGNTLDSGRIQALAYQLRTFDGPVRERAVAALSGELPPVRVYAAASADSLVLTMVVDGQYVREVYRGDLQTHRGNSISAELAENVTARSYPSIWAASNNPTGSGSGGTFIVNVPYPGGRLTAFVDGGSERVFKEFQRVDLDNVSTGEVRTRTIDLTLLVNHTYAGGPLRVQVLDPSTGEPIDATVKLAANGQRSVPVGRTGDDGVLWTVAPRGTFVVTAIEEDSNDLSTLELTSGRPLTVSEAYQPNGSGRNGASGGST